MFNGFTHNADTGCLHNELQSCTSMDIDSHIEGAALISWYPLDLQAVHTVKLGNKDKC